MADKREIELINELIGNPMEETSEMLPQDATAKNLSIFLGRAIEPSKSPREYYVDAYAGLYQAALPFMRAGQRGFRRGESLLLQELADSLQDRDSQLVELGMAIDPDGQGSPYKYSIKVEAEKMAEAFVKTEALESFDFLLSELLKDLISEKIINDATRELILAAAQAATQRLKGQKYQHLNAISRLLTSKAWINDGKSEIPSAISGIYSVPLKNLEERPGDLELCAPLLKDLIMRHRFGTLSEDSVGLAALSQIIPDLDPRALGLCMKIKLGKIESFQIITVPDGELMPPQYGPCRAMQSVLLSITEASSSKLENLAMEDLLNQYHEEKAFFVASVVGAVAAPKNACAALEGFKLNQAQNSIEAAVETFTFIPARSGALLVDPVAVEYLELTDELNHFSTTRLAFACLNPSAVTPLHQGAVSIGMSSESYESACLDGPTIAAEILNDSFSYLTGQYGKDEIAENLEEAYGLLAYKYSRSPALKGLSDSQKGDHEQMLRAIAGLSGPTHGMSAEVFSLFYQNKDVANPVMFLANIHVSRFLSDLRSFPQRFDCRKYLAKS